MTAVWKVGILSAELQKHSMEAIKRAALQGFEDQYPINVR